MQRPGGLYDPYLQERFVRVASRYIKLNVSAQVLMGRSRIEAASIRVKRVVKTIPVFQLKLRVGVIFLH